LHDIFAVHSSRPALLRLLLTRLFLLGGNVETSGQTAPVKTFFEKYSQMGEILLPASYSIP
jgi:hypothetical protein